jgi:endoglucanase
MEAAGLEFLQALLETPSPSGYERPVQDVVRKYAGEFAGRRAERTCMGM